MIGARSTRIFINVLLAIVMLGWALTAGVFAQRADLVVQTGHTSGVHRAIASPDGKVIASISLESTVTLWDAESGLQLRSLSGHTDAVDSIVFFPDGSMIAAGGAGYDGSIRLWDVATGELVGFFRGHDQAVLSLAFSRDGSKLASGSYDNTIKIWDTLSGDLLRTLTGHTQRVNSVAFSPDGNTIASGSFDGTIKLWKTETGEQISTLSGHSNWVLAIEFSPDGRFLLSGSWDETVNIWSFPDGKLLKTLKANSPIVSISLTSDGTVVAASMNSGVAILWSVPDGVLLRTLRAHDGVAHTVNFVRRSHNLITGGDDKVVRRWDIGAAVVIREYKGSGVSASSVLFSPDGTAFVSYGASETFRVWRIGETLELEDSFLHKEAIYTAAFSPDSRLLATSDLSGAISIWDIKRSRLVRKIEAGGWTFAMAFSKDATLLAIGGVSNNVETWSVTTGRRIRSFTGHTDPIRSVALSPDGKALVSTSDDHTIRFWNLETGETVKTIEGIRGRSSLSPDGLRLAAQVDGYRVGVFDLVSGTSTELKGHLDSILALEFSADGSTLITGSKDKSIIFWDLRTMQASKTLKDPADDILWSLSVPRSGKIFVTGGDGGKLKLWHKDRPVPLATIISLDEKRWVVVLPDGRFDTNKELDAIDGVHWVVSDDPFTAKPLEIFMRVYYEPRLFQRIVSCTNRGSCDSEFRPLPPITAINRIQPRVSAPRLSGVRPDGTVDVSIDVEDAVASNVHSGIYDLRLFVDRQLVASSVPWGDEEKYIARAESQSSGAEAEIWRETHDLARLQPLRDGKATFVFRNVLVPKNGLGEIEFSAYAFNADRVKSETARSKLRIAKPIRAKGKTFLLTIGVNASESSSYRLNYAANDARETQKILGERLSASGQSLVRINLVSDYDSHGELTENLATKKMIKGVFDVLGGRRGQVDRETLTAIDRAAPLTRIKPEDTLIVTFSGHGYTKSGVFYMLPSDIGEDVGRITDEVLPRLISSDELSLWTRDIVAREMVLIVDACHSAASVQGSDFKPGPLGSRGLGQLAYDKGMRVLAAAQTNNVALELRTLQHGLLSYSLLQDGIIRGLADSDTPRDGAVTPREWLAFAVKGVPELYKKVIEGKAKLAIGGEDVDLNKLSDKQKAEMFCQGGECKSKASVQQPVLFDFARRPAGVPLFRLKAQAGVRRPAAKKR
jgi:WD40 repeat protein